jgi:hypothetical protein
VSHEARHPAISIDERMYPQKTMVGGGYANDLPQLRKSIFAVCLFKTAQEMWECGDVRWQMSPHSQLGIAQHSWLHSQLAFRIRILRFAGSIAGS